MVAIAGLVSWFLWPKSAMREKYDRIRIGMTSAEVVKIMDRPPETATFLESAANRVPWETIASEHLANATDLTLTVDNVGTWFDSSTLITVYYDAGKAIDKRMLVRMTPLEIKLRDWLAWLRGLVVW